MDSELKLQKLREQRAEIVARSPAMRSTASRTPAPSTPSLKAASEAAMAKFGRFAAASPSVDLVGQRLNMLEQRLESARKFDEGKPREIVDPFESSDEEEFADASVGLDLDQLLAQERDDTIQRLRETSVTFDHHYEKPANPVVKQEHSDKQDKTCHQDKRESIWTTDAEEWIQRAKGLIDIGYEQGAMNVLQEALRRNVEPAEMIQDAMDDWFQSTPEMVDAPSTIHLDSDEDIIQTKKTTSVRVTIQGSPRTANQLIRGTESRVNLVQEMAKMLQNMSFEHTKKEVKTEIKSESDTPINGTPKKDNQFASHSPVVQLDVSGGSMTVLTPVRVTHQKDRAALGTGQALTPVRRSVRTNENVPTAMNELLESVDYAFVPNKVRLNLFG